METFAAIFFGFALLACIIYVFVILLFITGWLRTGAFSTPAPQPRTRISILIAARNESKNIQACLESIVKQDYDKQLYEVIVADDGSEDDTLAIIMQFAVSNTGMQLKCVSGEGEGGKKQALALAMAHAKGELVITTDADTNRGERWLSTVAAFYETHYPEMIIGPVAYHNDKSLFEKIQALELCGLVATGAAGAQLRMPVMCNGANLAFTRKAYDEAGRYAAASRHASGDDVMLMTRINDLHPGGIRFLRSADAMVYTEACTTFSSFIQQRVRWASKNRSIYNGASFAAGAVVFVMSFVLLAGFILSLFVPSLIMPVLILFGAKCIIDFLFLFLAAAFFEKRSHLLAFVPAQLFNILYTNVVALMAVPGGYYWKGRRQR